MTNIFESMVMKSRSKVFRKLLEGKELIFRPCAYDALSAILIERAGFDVIGTSGYGISASLIGQPDIGLLGYHEMIERTRTIVNAVSTPVDVDVDTGYGNALNTYWTVLNFARVGAAGVRIEDQVWPKRCGHMAGKSVIPANEMIGKIRAAVKARDEEDPDLVVGARTDARAVSTLDETVSRAVAFAKAGADYVYVESPQSLVEVERLVNEVPTPIAFNIIPGGKTPPFNVLDLEKRGVRYLSVPMVCLYSATKAMEDALRELKTTRDLTKMAARGVSWAEFNDIVGYKAWRRLELETLSEEELNERYGTTNLNEIMRVEREVNERTWKKAVCSTSTLAGKP
jgi:2-methylisocitrate lyase-like PEP mutase family enzyme